MGLCFDNSDASWSYSGFNRFRARLAEQIGIKLDLMEGFGGPPGHKPLGTIPWSGFNDPILPFLNHSDCDGKLTWEELRDIWPRLLELIKDWAEGDYDKVQALELAFDMRRCVLEQVDLKFT